MSELQQFILGNMPLSPVLTVPAIRLHQAGPMTGLRRLPSFLPGTSSPYWAYPWSGGLALARYFLERPELVAGRNVLDLGAGLGLVGIAAALAGAGGVIAADTDRAAAAALELNATANGVTISAIVADLTQDAPPPVDLVAVGDLFYERDLAARVTAFLDRCLVSGIEVLVGDPGRAFLPVSRLRRVAAYPVSGFADPRKGKLGTSFVYTFEKEAA